MRRKRFFKVFTLLAAMALVFTFSSFNAAARTDMPIQIAQLYGDWDFTSQEVVTLIVEMDAISMLEAKHTGRGQSMAKLQAERDQILAELDKITEVEFNRDYFHVFSGLSLNIPENQIPKLMAIPGVRAVYPDVEYTVTMDDISADEITPEMIYSGPYIGAERAWNELGYTGEGMTVAVIDTGCDYTHPDLVHAFGEYKGWDFVDDDDDPQETQDPDPDIGTAHGTHVSGTIAGNGLIKGIAPDAKLLAYRVLGPGGTGYSTDVIAGIEQAVLDGADVMNLSLGNTLNDPDYATSLALDRAMEDGVVAATSTGNAGPDSWSVGSPGTSRRAISVGATALPQDFFEVTISTAGAEYPSADIMGYTDVEDLKALDGKDYEFVYAGLGGVEDFEGLDLTGKIALIMRGEHAFLDKAANAAAAGAVGAIIFNNEAGDMGAVVGGQEIPTFKMSGNDGILMLNELAAGNNTVSFTLPHLGYMESVAEFSSRGPVVGTLMIKPDVCAPGVDIISTVPTHDPSAPHAYASYQGTSMSSPHVAGAAALLLQAHPDWNVDDVKAALMNTAVELTDPYTGESYPHYTQGAGSIRVDKAIETKTLVTPGSFSYGLFDKEQGAQVEHQKFEVRNLSNQRIRYSLDVEFPDVEGIKVNTSNNLNVQAGKAKRVNINLQVKASDVPPGYYEGTITLTGGGEEIRVPAVLFVGEPDYPLFGGAGMADLGDEVLIELYLPGGADFVFFDLYTLDLQPVAELLAFEDIPAGYTEFYWDKTAQGQPIPEGTYNLVAFIYKGDQAEGWVLDEVELP